MIALRRALWFAVGVLLSMVWGFSHAEIVAPICAKGWNSSPAKCDFPSACGAPYYGATNCTTINGDAACNCVYGTASQYSIGAQLIKNQMVCPAGYSPTEGGCYRPTTCPAGQTLNASGECIPEPCVAGQAGVVRAYTGAWSICPEDSSNCIVGNHVEPTSVCDGTCGYNVTSTVVGSCGGTSVGAVDNPAPIACSFNGVKTGSTCSSPSEPGTAPSVPNTPAPCAPGEGVMTSSTGSVRCVPAGTPGAETPKSGTKSTTKTNADGSTTTTITNTTCTGAGACSSTTTTTTTGVGGGTGTGATPGQAGTPGITTGTTVTTGDPSPETPDKPCDPKTSMCSSPTVDGLYTKKDKTIEESMDTFKNGLSTTALGNSTTGFFYVSIPTGSCPDWSASVQVLGGTFDVDMKPVFCSQAALNMMDIVGAVLMVVAAFGAFRWAIL